MVEVQLKQDAYIEVGGTIPWKESVESSLERRPRVKQESEPRKQEPRSNDLPKRTELMRQLKFKIWLIPSNFPTF